ncbi:MAG: flagellar motor switch protein FliG [Clostridiales bacterium]|jgi:flagellar motor switch protein FliG|nr:flagellar motor switch protein FliG [Clostridiales bacterium]
MAVNTMEMSGSKKAAVLLIALGQERSVKIFKRLKEDEIETLTLEIAGIGTVLPETKQQVLEEFYHMCMARQYLAEGGIDYAKRLLEQAVGRDKAREILGRLTTTLQTRPFESIRKTESSQITSFIQNEHPQTIALILSYLQPNRAAEVIGELPQEKQADVVKRIALMDRTSPDIIKEVEHALEKKLSSLMTEDYTTAGGVDSVVEILNSIDRTTEKRIMDVLEMEDAELSEDIKRKMFVFEDIVTLDNRSIQTALRQDIDNRELAMALRGSSQEVQDVVFNNISKRLASMIREDMDYMGPVRRADVDEAQQKIVAVIRRLQESGEIFSARGGGDDIIV